MNNFNDVHPWMVNPPGALVLMELKERGYSRKSFAKLLGMSKRKFNAYLKGKKSIVPIADKIAALFDVPTHILVNLQALYEEDKRYILSLKGHKRRGSGVYSKW